LSVDIEEKLFFVFDRARDEALRAARCAQVKKNFVPSVLKASGL